MVKGTFTPWKLLQIPVEFMTRILLEKYSFRDLSAEDKKAFADAISIASSLGTAAIAGLNAGPLAILGAITAWFIADFVSHALGKVF